MYDRIDLGFDGLEIGSNCRHRVLVACSLHPSKNETNLITFCKSLDWDCFFGRDSPKHHLSPMAARRMISQMTVARYLDLPKPTTRMMKCAPIRSDHLSHRCYGCPCNVIYLKTLILCNNIIKKVQLVRRLQSFCLLFFIVLILTECDDYRLSHWIDYLWLMIPAMKQRVDRSRRYQYATVVQCRLIACSCRWWDAWMKTHRSFPWMCYRRAMTIYNRRCVSTSCLDSHRRALASLVADHNSMTEWPYRNVVVVVAQIDDHSLTIVCDLYHCNDQHHWMAVSEPVSPLPS